MANLKKLSHVCFLSCATYDVAILSLSKAISLFHLRCPNGKLAKSCKEPVVMGRVGSGGEFSTRLLAFI